MEQVLNFTKQIADLQKMTRLLTVMVFALLSVSASAQTVSIQGVLRDPNGRSVDNGFYEVTFKIYDVESGGTELWSETYPSLETKHGVFQANLGENTSLDGLAFDTEYYVGVTVENYAEMTPRIKLTIYPYAKAILGQDNKFPSTGNIVLEKDSIVVKQGALKFEGANGRIVFNDGTSLNTADFGGPASGLLNPSSVNINADNDATGSDGYINFQLRGANVGSFGDDGRLYLGRDNDFEGRLSLMGGPAGVDRGGQITFHTTDDNDDAGVDHFNLFTYRDSLVIDRNELIDIMVIDGSSGHANFGYGLSTTGTSLSVGNNDTQNGTLNLYGHGTGFTGGGRVNYYKAADHDGDGSATATEYWFMEAYEDDLRVGNIWANNNVMTFSQTGGVGIGAGAFDPQFELAIGDHDTGIDWVDDGDLEIRSNGGAVMRIAENGSVGIGDADPTEAKLVIRNSLPLSHDVAYAWSSATGNAGQILDWPAANGGNSGFFSNFAVWTDGQYAGNGFLVFSDERIKEVIGRSNNKSDLDLIRKIKITDYSFIDKIQSGNKVEKKVIAQEVATIFPQAISTNTGVVPNIFEVPQKATYTNGVLRVELHKSHQLAAGDKVQCYIDHQPVFLSVESTIDDRTFTALFDKEPGSMFVYGQEVDDFHTVDYDAIAMLNVSATQELAKRSDEQADRIAALEAENAALREKLEKVDMLEAKLNAFLDQKIDKSAVVGQR